LQSFLKSYKRKKPITKAESFLQIEQFAGPGRRFESGTVVDI